MMISSLKSKASRHELFGHGNHLLQNTHQSQNRIGNGIRDPTICLKPKSLDTSKFLSETFGLFHQQTEIF